MVITVNIRMKNMYLYRQSSEKLGFVKMLQVSKGPRGTRETREEAKVIVQPRRNTTLVKEITMVIAFSISAPRIVLQIEIKSCLIMVCSSATGSGMRGILSESSFRNFRYVLGGLFLKKSIRGTGDIA